MIALDTSILIDLFREARKGVAGPATRRLERAANEPVGVPVFALCELESGLARDRTRADAEHVHAVTAHFEVLYPDERFAPTYGHVLAHMLERGRPPGTMDLLIGVSALIARAPLVTRDGRGFFDIPGLEVELLGPERRARKSRRR